MSFPWAFSLGFCLLVGVASPAFGGANTLFHADFESGDDGFTYVADPDVASTNNLWHRSSIKSVSPSHSMYYGLEGSTNYNTGARNAGNLQSPTISLAGVPPPVVLSFSYALQSEGGGVTWDPATVQISANGGSSWTTLITTSNAASAALLTPAVNFAKRVVDISAYAGSNIMVRFNFDTLDADANSYQGWFVDEVVIAAGKVAYVRSTNSIPWGHADNEWAMTRVFGTNWQDLRYETVDPVSLFGGNTRFIFMDGSDENALEMGAFLTNNMVAMSNWVAAGGSLFLNSAPNEGGNIDFGFGVTLINPSGTSSNWAINPAHPIFNGPLLPVGTGFSGGAFAHAVVSGTGLEAILTNGTYALPSLAEKSRRQGHVIFGGMTVPYFHTPQPQGSNLLANIVAHGASYGLGPEVPEVAVFDNPAYVDTTGGSTAESDTVQASLAARGFPTVTFTDITAMAAVKNVLLFPEQENGALGPALTAGERSALSNFVVSGGSMIVHGSTSARAGGLINSVLGLSLLDSGWSGSGTTHYRTAAATGTQFADDPASMPWNSACSTLQTLSLPPGSRSIYETNGQSIVAEMYCGAGKVIFLGWDWFDAAPLGTEDDGWLQVLESAVLERSISPFYDDFEPNTDLAQWSAFGGVAGSTVLATNYGGSVSGANSLWFGASGSRYAASRSLNTASGGSVNFWLRIADGSGTWEHADLPGEGIVLEYSTNSGGSWVEMGRYDTDVYRTWTHIIEAIPLAAQTVNTRFRWRQLYNSGSGSDHWALDNVSVNGADVPPAINVQPENQIVLAGSSALFSVAVSGTPPLSYVWRRNGTPIAGATNSFYATNNVQLVHSGAQFSCLVSNDFGTATSSNAALTVMAVGADTVTINATDKGWYDSSGYHNPGNSNYVSGEEYGTLWRDWFVFNVPPMVGTLTGRVARAELLINSYNITTPSAETYELRQVTTGIGTLMAGGSGLTNIYNDLGDGTLYGSRGFVPGDDYQVISIPLNAAFINALEAAGGGQIALGGSITTLGPETAEYVFGSSSGDATDVRLRITYLPPPVLLSGDYLYLPINTNGVFLAGTTGGRYNPAGTGGASGTDFWYPGTPVYNYVVGVGGTNHVNGQFTSITVTNLSGGGVQRAVIDGVVVPGLHFTRDVSFANNSKVIQIIDTLQNTSGAPLNNLVTLDCTDPDQDSSTTTYTSNDVVSVNQPNDMVVATGPTTGLSLGFGSDSSIQIPSAVGFDNRDAYSFLTVVDPNGTNADIAINMAQNYGTLAAGQSRSVAWNMVFGNSKAEVIDAFTAPPGRVLVIWDTIGPGTVALSNALANAGISVSMSATAETGYSGDNPSPNGFAAVIHLNGTTYGMDMPVAGQTALSNYVHNGGGYIQNEWDAYDYGDVGLMARMRDLILFDRTDGGEGSMTLATLPPQAGHPVLAGIPASITFQGGHNVGLAHVFSSDPVTVLMREGTNDAVAVREFGSGRVVGFHHAGNYGEGTYHTLSNAYVQQLYVNAVRWAANQAHISNTNIWNGSESITSFGEQNTATYGQTFKAPAQSTLERFTVFLNNETASVDFRFYVMAWDGVKATGPILYQSAPASTLGQTGWHPFTFYPGITLIPGANYVAFVSASTLFDGTNSSAAMGYTDANSYTNGGFVFQNNGADFASLTNSAWDDYSPSDLAFDAVFSGVPAVAPELMSVYNAGVGTLTLSWSDPNFHLQWQTNMLQAGLSNNWLNYPGGSSSPVIITPSVTNPAVFFRLTWP